MPPISVARAGCWVLGVGYWVPRDRDTERQKNKETERQRDRKTKRQKDQEAERHRDRRRDTAKDELARKGALREHSVRTSFHINALFVFLARSL